MDDSRPKDESRPERSAGGFAHDDGTVQFYTRVQALLSPEAVILDLGAGRGLQAEDEVAGRQALATLRKPLRHVVGADIDAAVLRNPLVDEAVVLRNDAPLPFPDGRFDMVVCDWVLEHVADPAAFAREVHRVLKAGGWFCARTPNRYGYIALGAARAGRFEDRILAWLQPARRSADIFPKFYRLNTMASVRSAFPPRDFQHCSYYYNPEPAYADGRPLLHRLIDLYQRFSPRFLSTCLFVFVRKQTPP